MSNQKTGTKKDAKAKVKQARELLWDVFIHTNLSDEDSKLLTVAINRCNDYIRSANS